MLEDKLTTLISSSISTLHECIRILAVFNHELFDFLPAETTPDTKLLYLCFSPVISTPSGSRQGVAHPKPGSAQGVVQLKKVFLSTIPLCSIHDYCIVNCFEIHGSN